jgi:hypothetical protein
MCKKARQSVEKNMSVSAFGVDHGSNLSKGLLGAVGSLGSKVALSGAKIGGRAGTSLGSKLMRTGIRNMGMGNRAASSGFSQSGKGIRAAGSLQRSVGQKIMNASSKMPGATVRPSLSGIPKRTF